MAVNIGAQEIQVLCEEGGFTDPVDFTQENAEAVVKHWIAQRQASAVERQARREFENRPDRRGPEDFGSDLESRREAARARQEAERAAAEQEEIIGE